MNHKIHSHCAGDAALPKDLKAEIIAAITSIRVAPKKGVATKIRDAFLSSIHGAGWSSEVSVSKDSGMTITSMKDQVGLCLQTGNMSRIYADLMKLQTLYLDNSIKAAAIILPSKDVAKLLGDNIAAFDRLERELEIFKKAYHVPTLVISMEQ